MQPPILVPAHCISCKGHCTKRDTLNRVDTERAKKIVRTCWHTRVANIRSYCFKPSQRSQRDDRVDHEISERTRSKLTATAPETKTKKTTNALCSIDSHVRNGNILMALEHLQDNAQRQQGRGDKIHLE